MSENQKNPLSLSVRELLLFASLSLLFGLLYYEPFQMIWRVWNKESGYYSHGPLIPFVALWMVYSRLDEIRAAPMKTSWIGLPLVLLCSLAFLASTLCHMYPPKYFIFVFYMLAFSLLLFGWQRVRLSLIPWAFLFFMTPLPDGVIDLITYKLRILVTASAVAMTEPLNWYVVKSGNYIFFPNGETLVVGDICAGLRSIISLLALGAVFASQSRLTASGSLILFLLSGPVAILTNILRIFALIVIGYYWGSNVASGKAHDLSGWAIFVVAFSLLYLCYALLEKVFYLPAAEKPAEKAAQP